MSEYIEINNINCITINTDASFNHRHQVSGYCYYIKSNYFTISAAGQFKNVQPKCSSEAELMCIGNALYILLKKDIPAVDFIVINSDSKIALSRIKTGKTKIGHQVFKILSRLKRKLKTKDVRLKHVKAHSGFQDKRSWANEYCDKNAKMQMRIALSNKLNKPMESEPSEIPSLPEEF